jgi:hypothetical protein
MAVGRSSPAADPNHHVRGELRRPLRLGRREINCDGVPDGFAAPNNLPANFLQEFPAGRDVFLVRITSGHVELGGERERGGRDLVVMDDFIYDEPQPLP